MHVVYVRTRERQQQQIKQEANLAPSTKSHSHPFCCHESGGFPFELKSSCVGFPRGGATFARRSKRKFLKRHLVAQRENISLLRKTHAFIQPI